MFLDVNLFVIFRAYPRLADGQINCEQYQSSEIITFLLVHRKNDILVLYFAVSD